MNKIIAILLLIIGVSCSSTPDKFDDDNVEQTSQASHAWSNFRWNTSNGVANVTLNSRLSSTWSPFLNVAASDWSDSNVLNVGVSSISGANKGCRPTLARVEVCNAKYGRTGWLGVASVWVNSSGYITQATVKLNDTYFSRAPYNTPDWRMLVMCQEVGHAFGLDHQDENFSNPNLGTCMDYTNNPAGPPSNTRPNAHDYEELEIIYESATSSTGTSTHYVHVFPAMER